MRALQKALQEHPLFPKRPLFLFACGFLLGLLLSRHLIGRPAYALTLFLLSLGILLFALRYQALPLVLIACALGILRLQIAYPALPAPRQACSLTGTVADTPVEAKGGWVVTLHKAALDGKPLDGRALLFLPEMPGYTPAYGHHISTTAAVSLPQGARNIGGMDLRFYNLSQGIVCTATGNGDFVEYTAGRPGLFGSLLALKESSTRALISLIGEENGALAAGMLHGDTLAVPDEALADFRASGIAHLLAVSGLHVTLLAGMLLLLLRRAAPSIQVTLISVFLLFYCMLTAFSASTVRAAVMMLCLLLGSVFSRRNDPLTSLSLSFLLITLVSPFQVFAVGFALSFTAVLGILLIYPRIREALKRLPGALADVIGVSLAAQAATLPVTAAVFHNMPLLAPVANMLAVPLAPLVMLPAVAALALYPISMGAAGFFAGISDVTLRLMRAAASAFASGGAFTLPAPTFFAGLLFFALLLFFSRQCLLKACARRAALGILASACLILWMGPRLIGPTEYAVVLDVPFGYAVHVRQNGKDRLITSTGDAADRSVEAYLLAAGISGYTLEKGGGAGLTLTISSMPIRVAPGFVEAGGALYAGADTGQLTIRARGKGLALHPYARDHVYDILIE